MDVRQIKEYFDSHGRASLVFESIDSTNTYLKAHPQDFGTLALALSQTAGHGQFDRVFESPDSGLYMSLCVKYIPSFPMTLASANAVFDSLYELCGIECRVKWVNDIIFDSRKLCGILAESVFCGDSSFTVIGFGMNLKKGRLSDDISKIAISLEEIVKSELPDGILPALALKIAENLEKELSRSKQEVIERYKRICISEIPENAVFI
ncbi:MAG: biotin--[acetyl-CoA-carboxylase] ligase [Clostridia bacterium]|nr:biotin--[acetyl-CoA-carboxylase] ligase [Clostridia bacterium]